MPDFVALLADEDAEIRAQAARGLQRLTGQKLEGAAAWKAWLQANEGTWRKK